MVPSTKEEGLAGEHCGADTACPLYSLPGSKRAQGLFQLTPRFPKQQVFAEKPCRAHEASPVRSALSSQRAGGDPDVDQLLLPLGYKGWKCLRGLPGMRPMFTSQKQGRAVAHLNGPQPTPVSQKRGSR